LLAVIGFLNPSPKKKIYATIKTTKHNYKEEDDIIKVEEEMKNDEI
jgi:hypothetical protein